MRVTTSCSWLLACLLVQGISLDRTAAAETQSLAPATAPSLAESVRTGLLVSSLQLTLPDEGPRYRHLVEAPGSVAFQKALDAFTHAQYGPARAGFEALVKQGPEGQLAAVAQAFLAELALLESPTIQGRSAAITQYRTLLTQHPKDLNASRALWRIGDIYLEMGWVSDAIGAYQYATTRMQTSADADRSLLSLGVILESREQWADTEQAFGTVRKRSTDDRVLVRATLGQAKALCALKREREAHPLYAMLYQRWPDRLRSDSQALRQYGEILAGTNQLQRARAIDSLLYNLYPLSPYASAALLRLGNSHRHLGLQKQAEMFYLAVQTQYAGTMDAGIARMQLARSEQEVAASAGEFLLKRKVEGLIRGARASYLEPSEGEALYASIAKEHPQDALGSEALFQLASHYELHGAPSRAVQTYLDVTKRVGVVDHDPWPQAARLRLAVLLKPRLEAALRSKNDVQVLTVFHTHGQAPEQHYLGTKLLLEVADAHRRLGFFAEAARLYRVLVRDRKATGLYEPALLGLGESYLSQGASSSARNAFEIFRLQYPKSPQSMLVVRQLVTAMREQGDRRSAIRVMRQWLLTHPRESERGWVQLTLAKTLLDDHQTGEAVTAFEEALRQKYLQSPGDRLLFADLLMSLNKHQQALALYQGILASNPSPGQAEWARVQMARSLTLQTSPGPVRTEPVSGAIDDPLMGRAAAAIQASLRVTTEKEGG